MCADNIGKNAVTFVDQAIRNCALLASHIEKNGNTPLWDGFVLVYHTSAHDKKSFFGKVPVQVKGTYSRFKSAVEVTEKAAAADLEGYLKDGGVIYFYVYMTEETHSIYYASLLPYDLMTILQPKLKQNKLDISLQKFPVNSTQEMTNIFMSFISDRKKQSGFTRNEPYTLEELQKQGVEIETLAFSFTGIGLENCNIAEYASTHTPYIYAVTKGDKRYIPIDKPSNIETERIIKSPIIIEGQTYYTEYTTKFLKGEQRIIIGASFILETPNQGQGTLSAQISGKLSKRIVDIKFLLALNKYKYFLIRGVRIDFNSINLTHQDVEALESTLLRFEMIKQVLDELDVQEDLDVEKITDGDERTINLLIEAVLHNRKVGLKNVNRNSASSGFIVLSDLTILIIYQPSVGETSEYYIKSFTKTSQIKIVYQKDSESIEVIGSNYLLLQKEHYIKASNVNIDIAFASLTSFGNDEVLLERINNSMLEVLKAYDETKNEKMLLFAEKLSSWIITNRPNPETSHEIDTLNHLQIVKRRRKFTPEETVELILIKKNSQEASFLCASHILLDEFADAARCFGMLEDGVKKDFLEYPICVFLKEKFKFN